MPVLVLTFQQFKICIESLLTKCGEADVSTVKTHVMMKKKSFNTVAEY